MGVRRLQHNEAGLRCRRGEGVTIRDERIVRWDRRDLQALGELGQERRYCKGAYPSAQGTTIAIALSQEELSSMIGASRDSVTRALTALRSRGWVATSRRSITLMDVDALRTFVAESEDWD
jgi:CRP-like cAMP-binding protein